MQFTKIDINNWTRKEYFDHYFGNTPCTYSMTVKLDISKLKKDGKKLYPTLLYGVTTILNRHEEFRTALDKNGQVGVFSDKPALPRSSRQAGERRRLPRRSWSWLPAQCSQRPHPGRSADGCASCVPLGITFAATPFPDFQAAGFSSSRPQSRLAIPRVFFLSVSSWVVTPFYLSA